jgi:glycosyltransferase involved in cell wall biosynthesis
MMRVGIICRNWNEDRVLPRFARYLAEGLGWELMASPAPGVDVYYLMGYFEAQLFERWPEVPVASLFTHREEAPQGGKKAALYDAVAGRVSLRIAMCRLYGEPLRAHGTTMQAPLPLEHDRFAIAQPRRRRRPVVGVAGYTYATRRKGEDLCRALISSSVGQRVCWTASGRGWPIPSRHWSWDELPRFYQDLDVLVCPSRVEGGPMSVLEALSCGVPVVVPRGVGIVDELPDMRGIYRYARGDVRSMAAALDVAAFQDAQVDRGVLRAAVSGHTVDAWCSTHREGFRQLGIAEAA